MERDAMDNGDAQRQRSVGKAIPLDKRRERAKRPPVVSTDGL